MGIKHFIIMTVFFFLAVAPAASPCSAINIVENDRSVVGANLDWPTGNGLIFINKRGAGKTAVADPNKILNPAKWKARYGNITFNLFGCDWPWGGMNEAGLVGCTLQLPQTQYPNSDDRPSIFMKQWLQYQLDSHRSVKDVIQSDQLVRIRPVSDGWGIHFLFADRSGDCAVIEYLDHNCVVYHQASLPVRALVNHEPYSMLIKAAGFFNNGPGKKECPYGNIPIGRFLKASHLLAHQNTEWSGPDGSIVENTFQILEKISLRSFGNTAPAHWQRQSKTQWCIVYDIANKIIYFHTNTNRNIRHINLKQVNFECTRPVLYADINANLYGNVNHDFTVLTSQTNRVALKEHLKAIR